MASLTALSKQDSIPDMYDFRNIHPEEFNVKSEKAVYEVSLLFGLNPRLAIAQGISIGNLKKLRALHLKLDALILESNAISAKDVISKKRLSGIGSEVAEIEYLMQDEWGFVRSASHHTHFMRINHCSCCSKSNAYAEDDWGEGVTIDSGCIVHNQT